MVRVVSHHGYRHLKTEHARVGEGTRGLEMGPGHVRKRSSQLRYQLPAKTHQTADMHPSVNLKILTQKEPASLIYFILLTQVRVMITMKLKRQFSFQCWMGRNVAVID